MGLPCGYTLQLSWLSFCSGPFYHNVSNPHRIECFGVFGFMSLTHPFPLKNCIFLIDSCARPSSWLIPYLWIIVFPHWFMCSTLLCFPTPSLWRIALFPLSMPGKLHIFGAGCPRVLPMFIHSGSSARHSRPWRSYLQAMGSAGPQMCNQGAPELDCTLHILHVFLLVVRFGSDILHLFVLVAGFGGFRCRPFTGGSRGPLSTKTCMN